MTDLQQRDRRHLWHPYTQHGTETAPVAIVRAKAASLFDAQGREILDLISSWWTCVHGHAHPALNEALCTQAGQLEHVMFAGFTHPRAVELAEVLLDKLGDRFDRVFYSDNGSTANEVALKMAYQYWRNRGEAGRNLFLCFEGDYHGDTLGAMSVSKGSGFFTLFEDLMCAAKTIPFPATFIGDETIAAREQAALAQLETILEAHRGQIAAVILEPLLQGAAGIRVCRPEYLRAVTERVRSHGVLVIFDEVATGFGRTGKMFAFEHIGLAPDIICLSKGLTSGYMPLAVTAVSEALFAQFSGPDFTKALAHGHSFTGNPLACAVALRSLQLFDEEDTMHRVQEIQQRHLALVPTLKAHPRIEKIRVLGSILAFDLKGGRAGYKSSESLFLRDWYLSHGLNIRPYGKTIYLMPPYCITDTQLDRAYEGMLAGLEALDSSQGGS